MSGLREKIAAVAVLIFVLLVKSVTYLHNDCVFAILTSGENRVVVVVECCSTFSQQLRRWTILL